MRKSITNKIAYTLGVIFIILIWTVLYFTMNSNIVIPSPIDVTKKLFELLYQKSAWLCIGTTVLHILCGLIIGIIISLILSFLSIYSKFAEYFFKPSILLIKTTPVASFIIIVLVWIDKNLISTLISAVIVIPVVYMAVINSYKSIDKAYFETSELDCFSFLQTFRYIILPLISPSVLVSFATASGLAWKAGIAAEVLCTPKNSIGKMIYDSKIYLEVESLFAWTIIVILLSFITDLILNYVKKHII